MVLKSFSYSEINWGFGNGRDAVELPVFSESRELVQRYFLVIFLLMLLFIIFVATWIAFYLAQGFVQPIEDLSQATRVLRAAWLSGIEGPLDRLWFVGQFLQYDERA